MAKRDYYEVLGIKKDADEASIKRAYRALAMKYHPDRNPGDEQAASMMKEINEAYAVLSDTRKRQLYDTYGHAGLEGYTQEDIFRGVDFSSLFREFGLRDLFGFGGNIFDNIFGRQTTTQRGAAKGADLRFDLEVSLEEVAFGTEKTVELPKVEQCAVCGGSGAETGGLDKCDSCNSTGQIVREQRSGYSVFRQISTCGKCQGKGQVVKQPCKECEGKGIIEKMKKITVTIPAGADNGYRIRIEGEGEKSGGIPGDLYIFLNVEKHSIFERHGDDIYTQQEVDLTTAVLGGEITVPGLDDDLPLEIPEGTQTGAILRIVDKGIQHMDGYGKGDEYVIVKVMTPTNLSEEERELLKEFRRLREKSDGEN